MTEKTEALRLADALMTLFPSREDGERAAAELRRLHAQRDALLEALKEVVAFTGAHGGPYVQARAAIKAVEEEQK